MSIHARKLVRQVSTPIPCYFPVGRAIPVVSLAILLTLIAKLATISLEFHISTTIIDAFSLVPQDYTGRSATIPVPSARLVALCVSVGVNLNVRDARHRVGLLISWSLEQLTAPLHAPLVNLATMHRIAVSCAILTATPV